LSYVELSSQPEIILKGEKSMRKSSFLAMVVILLLGLAMVLAGCGDDGKDGTNGVDGIDGLDGADGADGAGQIITLKHLASTASQGFDESAAEIVAFDPTNQRIFSVNANSGMVDVFSVADPADPTLEDSIDLAGILATNGLAADEASVGAANSVAVSGGQAAVAVEADPKSNPGWVVFIDTASLSYINAVEVGALPDMLTFTPDGAMVVVACEGEPEDYTVDPEGRVDLIRSSDYGLQTVTFTDFNADGHRAAELPEDVRIFGRIVDNDGEVVRPSTVAEDLEPEYVAVNPESTMAYVAMQENNAVAVIDLANARVESIYALGFKDHMIPGYELDPSNRDDRVSIQNWPVYGMFQPDAIAAYAVNGVNYLLTANEGDSRADWGIVQTDGDTDVAGDDLNVNMEEFRVKDLPLDPDAFPDAAALQENEALGRLKVTSQMGDTDGDGDFDELYSYGARSFSIWNADTGDFLFDSGSDFELITAQKYGMDFNKDNAENKEEDRSDDKGPEPEGVTTGVINGHTYAFIGLERMGGVFVYEVSNPYAPEYVQYINTRDLTVDPDVVGAAAGDLGPEGLIFVDAADSPNGSPLLMVANEVSGTVCIFQVEVSLLKE
jgi:hypothetical protein